MPSISTPARHPFIPSLRSWLLVGLLLLPWAVAEATDWQRLNREATAQYRAGNHSAAQASAEQAVALAETYPASSREASRLVSSLNLLALVHQAQEHYSEAQTLLERALVLASQTLRADHPNIASLETNLASIKAAVQQQEKAATGRRIEALNEEALALHEQGQHEAAGRLYERLLPQVEAYFGQDSSETARILASLADSRAARRQYAQAETLYQRALGIHEHQHDQIAQAEVLNGLATTFYYRRQYGKAEPLFLRALERLESEYGPEHPALLPLLDNLDALYQTLGRPAQAEAFRRRAADIRRT